MEGMYRTRSATTKPTGKKRLEAGRKGRMVQARARMSWEEARWSLAFSPTKAVCRRRVAATRVPRLRGSTRTQFRSRTLVKKKVKRIYFSIFDIIDRYRNIYFSIFV